MLVNNTPFETYELHGRQILVKREDLCCPYPGPSFSKMRGVVAHIEQRPEKTIGVLDTFHSKAGWAVAWACRELGKQAIDFWPRYKADGDRKYLPRRQQVQAHALGADTIALQAGRSAVLYHQAKKILSGSWGHLDEGAYMMPNALKLPESITENAAEVVRSDLDLPKCATIVISISSGTVAAGILLGLHQIHRLDWYKVILHMGYSRSPEACFKYMEKVAGISLEGRVQFINEGYGYKDAAKGVEIPFPCNPYYDAKAWKWMSDPRNLDQFGPEPIVFWNIGE